MDLAKKIKGKLPHIFAEEEHNEPSSEEGEETAGKQEAEAEAMGGDIPEHETAPGFSHAKALSRHLKAGNHAGVVEAIRGIMKSGKGNMESEGGGS